MASTAILPTCDHEGMVLASDRLRREQRSRTRCRICLERHQVVAVHPNQYIPETGYLACGETVLVTDAGVERLAKTETKTLRQRGITMETMQPTLKSGRKCVGSNQHASGRIPREGQENKERDEERRDRCSPPLWEWV